MYMAICTHMYILIYVRMYRYMYVYVYVRTYVCTYVCVYVCMYVCMYVCIRDATIHILSVSIYHLLCITIQRYIA